MNKLQNITEYLLVGWNVNRESLLKACRSDYNHAYSYSCQEHWHSVLKNKEKLHWSFQANTPKTVRLVTEYPCFNTQVLTFKADCGRDRFELLILVDWTVGMKVGNCGVFFQLPFKSKWCLMTQYIGQLGTFNHRPLNQWFLLHRHRAL